MPDKFGLLRDTARWEKNIHILSREIQTKFKDILPDSVSYDDLRKKAWSIFNENLPLLKGKFKNEDMKFMRKKIYWGLSDYCIKHTFGCEKIDFNQGGLK